MGKHIIVSLKKKYNFDATKLDVSFLQILPISEIEMIWEVYKKDNI